MVHDVYRDTTTGGHDITSSFRVRVNVYQNTALRPYPIIMLPDNLLMLMTTQVREFSCRPRSPCGTSPTGPGGHDVSIGRMERRMKGEAGRGSSLAASLAKQLRNSNTWGLWYRVMRAPGIDANITYKIRTSWAKYRPVSMKLKGHFGQ